MLTSHWEHWVPLSLLFLATAAAAVGGACCEGGGAKRGVGGGGEEATSKSVETHFHLGWNLKDIFDQSDQTHLSWFLPSALGSSPVLPAAAEETGSDPQNNQKNNLFHLHIREKECKRQVSRCVCLYYYIIIIITVCFADDSS